MNFRNHCRSATLAIVLIAVAAAANLARAQPAAGSAVIITRATQHDFKTLVGRVEAAIDANGMLLVATASASAGAANRGIGIPGDAVLMVFRNDFAVRMLAANRAAGIEAPLPIHVFDTGDGHTSLAYRLPSSVFRPYGSAALDAMAGELDAIFERIARAAAE